MKSNRWHFYDAQTGEFIDRVFTGPDHAVELNTPTGCKAIAGEYDIGRQRVDLETGDVIERLQAQVELDARMREQIAQRARVAIHRLEASQLRPMRELAINPNDASARARLQTLDGQIAELRRQLQPPP